MIASLFSECSTFANTHADAMTIGMTSARTDEHGEVAAAEQLAARASVGVRRHG